MSDQSEGGRRDGPPRVATGFRRDGHYEPNAQALVIARFTVKPQNPSVVEDIALSPDEDSVWDARPA